jgi:hypothetical protein
MREHPEGSMISHSGKRPSLSDICAQVKHLGYAISRRIRLYGEEFEVVSDPFPEADGIAVQVTTRKDPSIRVLQIPKTVLRSTLAPSGTADQEKAPMEKSKDQDRGKGAMEQDQQNQGGNTSMQGQLGHRDEDEELKDADADLGG